MKRVLLGGMKHETLTFVPGLTDLNEFRRNHLVEGADVFSPARGTGQEIDGIIQVAQEEGIELIPTIDAFGAAAPPVVDEAYAYMRDRILEGARANQGRLDGVMLPLHGAMTTESLEDPEGDLITKVREIVGPNVPIVVSFDMHCHLTDLSVKPADAIVGYHTHPHVDFYDTGVRAMRILARAMKGEVKPVVVQRKVRMAVSAETHNTSKGPMSELMARMLAMEKEPGILAVTVFATQPWMDVKELGWSFVVVTDGDRALAQAKADELGMMAWERRERFLVHKTPIAEAMQQALAGDGQPYVMADSADSVSGGSYGDGNVLLKALLEMGYQGTALLSLTDPAAVAACHAAGVGAFVTIPVGGSLTPAFFQPVPVTGRVKALSDGRYVYELPPMPVDVGRTAVLVAGGISIVLSERPAMTIDREIYHSVGLDPRNFKIVQVKSPGGFRTIYGPFAAGIFELDTLGPTDSDLPRLPFKKIWRPLWPFDMNLAKPW